MGPDVMSYGMDCNCYSAKLLFKCKVMSCFRPEYMYFHITNTRKRPRHWTLSKGTISVSTHSAYLRLSVQPGIYHPVLPDWSTGWYVHGPQLQSEVFFIPYRIRITVWLLSKDSFTVQHQHSRHPEMMTAGLWISQTHYLCGYLRGFLEGTRYRDDVRNVLSVE